MIGPKVYKIIEMPYEKRNNVDVPLEHFVLPFKKDRYIIYFPLKGMLSLVNKKFVDNIEKNNFVVNELFRVVSKNPSVEMYKAVDFENSSFALELTKDCVLKCVYCYARGGEKQEYMSWETAKAAIDWILKRRRSKIFRLNFHGGGEALLAFPMMKRCCEYAKQKCKKRGIKFRTGAVVNGTLITEDMAKWFKKIGMHLIISFDGTPEIQNKQRPFKSGSPSYYAVKNAIKILNKHKVWFAINTTITDKSVSKMPDMIKCIKELHPKKWSFAFIMECGRCAETGAKKPKYDEFLRNFKKVKEECNKQGIVIGYTKKTKELKSDTILYTNNCYACGEHIVITAGGYISSCGTITNEKDPRTKEFFFGNIKDGKVTIDEKRLAYLRKRTVNNMSPCKKCFAKYICRGTCLGESTRENGTIFKPFKEECLRNKKQSYEFIKKQFKIS